MQLRAQNRKIETAAFNALPLGGFNETVITIPMSDGTENVIRICRPLDTAFTQGDGHDSNNDNDHDNANESKSTSNPNTLTPLIALFHGGGFMVGSNLQMASFARAFATLYNVTVASLSYRLAPENAFPVAQDDAWDAIRWLASHAPTLGANLTKGFVVGGVSAGGNLAISVVHRSVATGLDPPITGLWAANPITTDGASVPEELLGSWISRVQNADAPSLSTADIEYLQGILRPDPLSPVFTPFADLCAFSALPPIYVQVAGMDPLRDDGLIYEAVAREKGVVTRMDVYAGMPHGFFFYFPALKESVRFLKETYLNMAWLLGLEGDEERVVKVMKGK